MKNGQNPNLHKMLEMALFHHHSNIYNKDCYSNIYVIVIYITRCAQILVIYTTVNICYCNITTHF